MVYSVVNTSFVLNFDFKGTFTDGNDVFLIDFTVGKIV